MEFLLLVDDGAVVEHEVPFRLVAASAYDLSLKIGERMFEKFRIAARGTWSAILDGWNLLPDRFTGESLYTHLLNVRRAIEKAHAQPVADSVHVVVWTVVDGSIVSEVASLAAPDAGSDRVVMGLCIAWRGGRVRFRRQRTRSIAADLWSYGEAVEITASTLVYRVVLFRTAEEAATHLDSLGTPSA